FDAGSAAYNVPVAIRLSGELDVAAVEAAVRDVIARHESLRTMYPETEDGPVQLVVPAERVRPDIEVVEIDASDVESRVRALASTT
ncbi:condensation domain-containing protein, partial [Rhodococcus sp. BP22]|uniref:condensation domain-containing protein n=1 Tax=Rhodococcus sp. BP22 TaxID=2758566 RepID=UPI001645DA97